mmetsp:Transcript_38991/g.59318  ORF Transcript_38991/g.59318 Transcript_38991/m.59318 type:complete len:81 (+) Transcript_38991:4803-5045(+)
MEKKKKEKPKVVGFDLLASTRTERTNSKKSPEDFTTEVEKLLETGKAMAIQMSTFSPTESIAIPFRTQAKYHKLREMLLT